MNSSIGILVFGFILGVRHATDADHVAAVATIVSQHRSVAAASKIGAAWGLGHTLTLLVVGGAIILFNIVVPPTLAVSMELCVAFMLIVLGALNLRDAGHPRALGPTLGRSVTVGVIHGLAGSAAVALLVLATIREPVWAVVYLCLFGLGTVVGMTLLTSIIALPFSFGQLRAANINRRLVQTTAFVSIGVGLALAYRLTHESM